jgi:ATP-dependent helicase STH1/SNF2
MQHYRNDWTLMFNNARTFNEVGSWVYIDAVEMEKVLDATFERLTVGSGLPGTQPSAGDGSSASNESAVMEEDDGQPVEEDDGQPPPSRARSSMRQQVFSDEEYLTSSEDD